MEQIAGRVGRKTLKFIAYLIDLFAFNYRLLTLLFHRQKTGNVLVRKVIFEQIYFTCVQTLPIIIPIALIIGSMLIVQFAKLSGQYDLGKTAVLLIVREVGPVITALLVILRSATAVTIEISCMNVFHEIDAIEMSGIDPMRIICLPRLIGITSAVLCLFIVFDLVSVLGGYIVVWIATRVPVSSFLDQIGKAITLTDITVGIAKAVCFGIAITVISLYRGFNTKKQITYIPVATSIASVECFFYCLIINVIISVAFYL